MSQELKQQNAATYNKLLKDMNDKYITMFEGYGFNDDVNDLKIDYDESRKKFEKFIKITPPNLMDMDAIGATSYEGGSRHRSRRHRRHSSSGRL